MEDVRKHLEIDATKLDEELAKQAARYLYVAEQTVNADSEYEILKAQVGQLEATLDQKVRAGFEGKKTTEAAIRGQVELAKEYQSAQRLLIAARGKRESLKALREAFYMRKDLLIQIAIKQRSEIESMLSGAVKESAIKAA